MKPISALLLSLTALVICVRTTAQNPTFTPQQEAFFESKVRPLLIERCYSCHTGKEPKGGLLLDSRAALLKGNASGSALVPGDIEKSLILHVVRYDGKVKMPPAGRLRQDEINALTEWVKMGAPFPGGNTTTNVKNPKEFLITAENRKFWSFVPVVKPNPPVVKRKAWVRSPIDAFLLQKMEEKGLQPAPSADRRTLLRRATFDLTGLPPTPQEAEDFLKDTAPNAWERVIDRLQASPAYGERWGRYWLDVVRYADSNGLDENKAFAHAYRYRDYVVRSFNSDKPYTRFILEQLAGDLLPYNNDQTRIDQLTATGFLVLGPKVLAEQDKPKMVMDIVDEQIEVTSKAFLGLTVACARCHNHKFDPISAKDYYAWAGIFKSTRTMADLGFVSNWMERRIPTQTEQADFDRYQTQKRTLEDQIGQLRAKANNALKARLKQDKLPEKPEILYTADEKSQIKTVQDLLDKLNREAPKMPVAMAVEEGKVSDCRIHLRGNTLTLGDEVPRGTLTVLGGMAPVDKSRSGRLELAQWLASERNPLTARVAVNRVWQHLFGEGLVRTPDNFGLLGDKPTHVKLLDWLAASFMESGWSFKRLQKRIMLSNAYKMSGRTTEKGMLADPDNRYFWRKPRRRLEAEAIRDTVLSVSGQLDKTLGGSLLTTPNNDYVTNDQSGNGARYSEPRRSLYMPIIRNALFDMFQAFDYGDPSIVNAKRATTTVAPQALYILNSPFVQEQAGKYAERLLAENRGDTQKRIQEAYLWAYGRPITYGEMTRATRYITQMSAALEKRVPAEKREVRVWKSFCHALMAANEFIYID
jgi:hypothetical protein